jgi:hypothetical protein
VPDISSGRAAPLERRPNLVGPERESDRCAAGTARGWRKARLGHVLLSFERPAGESPRLRPRRTLKTAQLAKQRNRRSASLACGAALKITVDAGSSLERAGDINDHRQDNKGTWWMPWHQESKKGVDGCDKPR